jgi:hypothetical protein
MLLEKNILKMCRKHLNSNACGFYMLANSGSRAKQAIPTQAALI